MKRVVLYSFGGGSWKTAKVVRERFPDDELLLLFTDTLYEDADAYRFGIEGAANVLGRRLNWSVKAADFPDYRVGSDVALADYRGNPEWRDFLQDIRERAMIALPELVWLVEGRDPWEVFRDERFLGNSSIDPCSKIIKRRTLERWRMANCDPADTVFYVGIGEHEAHRYDDGKGHGIRPRMAEKGWTYEAPLIEPTAFNHENPVAMMRRERLRPGRNYALGYIHDNCGGFCCKAGMEHFKRRRMIHPDRYAYDSWMEERMRTFLSADVSMLTDRAGGDGKKPLTLEVFGARLDADPQIGFDFDGDSGCGCMLDGDE
jgi:hypothetical protein